MVDRTAFDELLASVSLPSLPSQDLVEIIGSDPVIETPFLAGEAVASALAAQAASVLKIWEMRTGKRQCVSIDLKAAVNSLTGLNNIYQSGHLVDVGITNEPTVGFYPTLDSKWIFVLGLFPHLRDGLLNLLNSNNSREAMGESISKYKAQELEDTIAEHGLSGGMLRTQDEWRLHPQGKALLELPVVDVLKIGESEPQEFKGSGNNKNNGGGHSGKNEIYSGSSSSGATTRPLSGIRVIDMTRLLAGPMATRLLAEQGADVMHISSPNLPFLLAALLETGWGKRSAYIDLDKPQDVNQLKKLVSQADIFVENYHRSGLSKHGLSPLELANLRPGIIYVSESAYGEAGPWQYRRGAEQLAETVTGISAELGAIDSPKLFPGYLNDYLTGYLAAFGACAALIRRATHGGSYWVRVSLCRTAMWIQDLGRVEHLSLDKRKKTMAVNQITANDQESYMIESPSPFGIIKHVAPVAKYSETPSYYQLPVVPLGAHMPAW